MAFVKQIGIASNYDPALLAAVTAITSGQIVLTRCGVLRGNAILKDSVAQVVAAHGADWDRRVAELFSSRFSLEEMDSIATLQKESPYFDTFATTFKAEIQPAMIALNKEIFASAYVDIIDPAMKRAMAECPGG